MNSKEKEYTAREIIGFDIDFHNLPDVDLDTSDHPEAIKYRVASVRLSNAIEGVILTKEQMEFMDNIPIDMPMDQFIEKVLKFVGA